MKLQARKDSKALLGSESTSEAMCEARDARDGAISSSPKPENAGTPPDPREPASYDRRILLGVTGLSPQVVTETIYALAVDSPKGKRPFLPTEVHLITTGRGRKQAINNLLLPNGDKPGWFHRLCEDYRLPSIRFDKTSIHAMQGTDGEILEDIRTPRDNELAADYITAKVRELTADDRSAVHVSLAGGRKTMGFYLGYALSLYARPQDRLSHVLVTAPYESHPKFYYPTPYDEVIHTMDKSPLSLNTRQAEVSLAIIPVVSLRHGLPSGLLEGSASFNATVAAASDSFGPAELVIEVRTRSVRAAGRRFQLPPTQFSLLAILAWRTCRDEPALRAPIKDQIDHEWSQAVLADLKAACGHWHVPEGVEAKLDEGVSGAYFSEHLSHLRKSLKRHLGTMTHTFRIDDGQRRPRHYKLAIPPECIRFDHTSPADESYGDKEHL